MQNMQNTYTAGVWGFLYKKSILSTTTSLKNPFPIQKIQKNHLRRKKGQFFCAPSARPCFACFAYPPAGGGRAVSKKKAKHAKHPIPEPGTCRGPIDSAVPATQARPCCRQNLKKSGEIPPPLGHPPWGEPHFFPTFGDYMV